MTAQVTVKTVALRIHLSYTHTIIPSRRVTSISFKVFGLTRLGMEWLSRM